MRFYDVVNRAEGLLFKGLGKSSLVPLFSVVKEMALSIYFSVFDEFHDVEIETTSICNRRCVYCPNAFVDREQAYMEQTLFKKIIAELSAMKFSGNLNLHHFGEPLVDKRLPVLVAAARRALPSATIQIFTNGDLLTIDTFRELVKNGVNHFFITSHCVEKDGKYVTETAPALEKFFSSVTVSEIKMISYSRIEPGSILANRPVAGKGACTALPLNKFRHIVWCSYATRLFEIDYSGKVLLCCQQQGAATGPVLGDLSKESIHDIWNRPNYKLLRKELRHGKRELPICRQCGWGTWDPPLRQPKQK